MGSNVKRDYSKPLWTRRELAAEIVKCTGLVVMFSLFFYKSLWACLPLCILGYLYGRLDERKKIEKDRQELLFQFRDMIRSVEASVKAGYSLENAFLESYRDMSVMHGKEAMICRELLLIRRGLVMNIGLVELLEDLARRSHLTQIEEFASVLAIARKSGGNTSAVITSSVYQISRTAEVKEEILIQTAEKRMEQRIMNIMPFAIPAYLEISSKGYFDILYHNPRGIVIMTGCLALYLTAYCLSEKIIQKALRV